MSILNYAAVFGALVVVVLLAFNMREWENERRRYQCRTCSKVRRNRGRY